jgi:hypothetical protein
VSEEASALYPPGNAPTAWFGTLRTVLEQLGAEAGPAPSADLAETLDAAMPDRDPTAGADLAETVVLDEATEPTDATDATDPAEPWRPAPESEAAHRAGIPRPHQAAASAAAEALAERLRAVSPEAADVPPDLLRDLLAAHDHEIDSLTRAFGLDAPTLLVTLGRGLLPGELDPVAAAAVTAQVPELRGVISSGSVSVYRDDRNTTLIAATTVGDPTGPVRLTDDYWEQNGMTDVWLCAVAPGPAPITTARALFERILPQAGVLRAHLRTSERRRLHVGLQAVAADADPDLVMGRLEGWRSAVEQMESGLVDVVWEQA